MLKQDVGDPTTVVTAVVDGLLAVAIIVSWLGIGVMMLARKRQASDAALFVAATGFATSVSVLVQFRPGPVDKVVMVLAVVVALLDLGVVARVLWRNPGQSQALRRGTVIAGVGALILPLAQFWHTTSWASVVEKASLSLTPSVQIQGMNSANLFVNVKMDLKNASSGRVRIIHSAVDVCFWAQDEEVEYQPDVLRGLKHRCTRWNAFAPLSWLDGDTTLTGSLTLRMPRASPRLVLVSRLAYARGDRLQVVSDATKAQSLPDMDAQKPRECTHAEFYRVKADSRGRALAQADSYLGYADRKGVGGTTYFLITGKPNRCQDSDQRLIDYYGVTETRVITENWLVPDQDVPSVQSVGPARPPAPERKHRGRQPFGRHQDAQGQVGKTLRATNQGLAIQWASWSASRIAPGATY